MEAKEARLLKEVREQFTPEVWRKWRGLIEVILERVQSSAQARHSLEQLLRAGCNPAVVLREVGLYFAGLPDEKETSYAKTQLKTIAARVTNDADILERIVDQFMKESADHYGDAVYSPLVLRQVAKSLQDALVTLKRHTHGKTGTTKHLVYLSYHVNAATRRKHYKEIAKLIAGILGDTSINIIESADSIRQEIYRHEKRHPKLFREQKTEIEHNLRSWRHWLSTKMSDV